MNEEMMSEDTEDTNYANQILDSFFHYRLASTANAPLL